MQSILPKAERMHYSVALSRVWYLPVQKLGVTGVCLNIREQVKGICDQILANASCTSCRGHNNFWNINLFLD